MSRADCDIAIVGGGLAGSALALALGGSGWRVVLLEARGGERKLSALGDQVDDFDLRVSAITPASSHWLCELGAWQLLAERRLSPYRHMQVWDGQGTGSIAFDCVEVNRPLLGHIVENRELEAALWQRLRSLHDVEIRCPASVREWRREREASRLVLEDGSSLTCGLVVAADGARSRLRDWAGFRTRQWDYGHRALVATVASERPHGECARQVFLPTGPLALLPLITGDGDQRYCSIVWSAVPERAEALLALDNDAFCAELGRCFEHRLGRITAVSQRAAFPLQQCHAVDYVQPGLALVADAAHSIHPLAGQGINLGFKDVAVLAQELLQAHQRGLAPGDPAVLGRYQRRRKADNLAMMATMEGFKQLFGRRELPLRWLRNTGLNWVDQLGPVKRQLMRQAMGL